MFVILNWAALRLWRPNTESPSCCKSTRGPPALAEAMTDDGTVSAGGIALQEGEYPGGPVWYDLGTNQKITLAVQRI
jgi:hypothetical protein